MYRLVLKNRSPGIWFPELLYLLYLLLEPQSNNLFVGEQPVPL